MAWSGGSFTRTDGTFSGTSIWQSNRDAGTAIRADRQDTHDQDLATGINACLTKDGSNSPSANLPMATFKHTGVGNAAARDQYASAAQVQDGGLVYAAGGGTADAITATLSPAITAYANGMLVRIRASGANTVTTPTLNLNGIGATTITKTGGVALVVGDIVGAGHELLLQYNSTSNKFELLNPLVQSGAAKTVTTTRGDIIVRGASVDGRLAVGAANRVLKSDGTDPGWGQVTGPMIAMGSDAQGDILYHNGTNYVRLGAGTSGHFLKTNGAGANPAWAAGLTGGITTIASGSIAAAATQNITDIPATYAALHLKIVGASSGTATRHPRIQISTDNGSTVDSTAGNYLASIMEYSGGGAASAGGEASLCPGLADGGAAETWSIDVFITGYQGGPHLAFTFVGVPSTGNKVVGSGFYVGGTTAINAIRLLWNGSGSFDAGTYALYGVN